MRLAIVTGLGVSLLWAYWPTLTAMARQWSEDPQYSHGYLVPVFAAALLWLRREQMTIAPALSGWGVALLLLGGCLQLSGTFYYLTWLEGFALLPSLLGVAVLLGGWQNLRWSWPAVAFLLFMIPLPYRAQTALAAPLQRIATMASTFTLQTLGYPAVSEGNVIVLNEVRLGIVEACSGLTMLVTFFALATAVAILVRRPWLDRVLIVASAVPIALIANVTRITVTGALHVSVGGEIAQAVFHDWAGWFMMPLALGLFGGVLWVLPRLFLEPEEKEPPSLEPFGIPARPHQQQLATSS